MGFLIIPYCFSMLWLHKKKTTLIFIPEQKEESEVVNFSHNELDLNTAVKKQDENIRLNFKSITFILSKVGLFIFSLFSVYFLEYGCTTVFNDVFTK